MASRIEQTIDDIYEYLEGCKYAAFSNKESIIVNKDDIYELLEELKNNTPDEIKNARQLAANRDAILEQAKARANEMLEKAAEKQGELIEKNEIMQQAYAQATEVVEQAKMQAYDMLNQATTEANNYQLSAVRYTSDSLANISDILTKAINEAQGRYSDLITSLSECLKVVNNDRTQLTMAADVEQVNIPGTDSQARQQAVARSATPPNVSGTQDTGAAKPPVVDRANSIRESINDDDIDNI
jgi:vacuolar-type H+-ATPase subunit H